MSLDYGRKYTHNGKNTDDKNIKEGVEFNKISDKWTVNAKNKTKSKYLRPIVRVAQFNTEKEAVLFYENYNIKK